MSRFLLRFPSFSARILAKSRPLRQTLFASSATGGASQALPPTSQLSVKHFGQQKSTAIAVHKCTIVAEQISRFCTKIRPQNKHEAILRPASRRWLPLPRLNQRHREPCHASSCGSRLFLLVFSQKADRCAKPCSLLPPPVALLRLCHRLRLSVLSISGNKKSTA